MQAVSVVRLACVTLAALATSCSAGSTNCTDIAEAGLTVYVLDQTTGSPICNATVTATDGAYNEVLQQTSPASGCYYAGAYERAGTYDVAVSAPGYTTNNQTGIVVPAGVCHVQGQTLTFDMN